MNTPILQLSGVSKSFGALKVINGIDLAIEAGEHHAIIGPNGAGKSTIFNMISGALLTSAGKIHLDGNRIDGLPPHIINRMGLSRSFQITNIYPRLSVFENLRIGAMARRGMRFQLFHMINSNRELTAEASALADELHLSDRLRLPAGQLPYSEQRLLEIGMTLATGPRVILLDEPTAGMSREEAAHVVEMISRVTKGKTLVVIEHDMTVVFQLCQRISVLAYGDLIASGPTEEVRANPAVRTAYLGEEMDA